MTKFYILALKLWPRRLFKLTSGFCLHNKKKIDTAFVIAGDRHLTVLATTIKLPTVSQATGFSVSGGHKPSISCSRPLRRPSGFPSGFHGAGQCVVAQTVHWYCDRRLCLHPRILIHNGSEPRAETEVSH